MATGSSGDKPMRSTRCARGCTLASAIAANLCRGMPLLAACAAATDYVHGALRHATRPGRSRVAVLDHFWQLQG